MNGFTYYDDTTVPQLTSKELLATLSAQQKSGILNGFADGTPAIELKHKISVPTRVISYFYGKLDDIEEFCRKEMRGERLVTPEELDGDGNVVTPAEYNTVPAGIVALRGAASTAFTDDFSSAQTGAVVNKMVAYSKSTKDGDWAFYSVEVKK